ncbi:multiple inositol polyphosphate phosphatase 1 [Diachasmimorpha longicaudata]|uniref:multiple inositol polyphosphate phosphatase 1 n=1 Tax=Diachasmimorpha longicaudata TaxID=58733 RepID=UPI0030B86E11
MFRSCYSILLIFLTGVLSHDSLTKWQCTPLSDDFKCRLSSTTPYRYIANYDDSEIKFKDCKAKKIWLMIRHGTRNPGNSVIKSLGELVRIKEGVIKQCDSGNCGLTKKQLKRLRDWKTDLKDGDEMRLTEEGENEMIGLGERFQERFPELMPEKYDNKTFKFKFTQKQRTEESAKCFTIGLFGKKGSENVWYPPSEEKDPILRFYKACDRWQRTVKKSLKPYEELKKFKESDIALKMVERISNRLGTNVSFDNARVMKDMCAFETAWSEKNKSPWCDLLTKEEFKIIEFSQDLKYYWIDGYGFSLSRKQACTAFKDMFEFMARDDSLMTNAYFTHSGTVLKILALLGVAQDDKPLRHDQFPADDRLWKTSSIDAFATNIAFVLFNCKSTGKGILVMHQERIINLPGCPENVPCPLTTMKDKYPDNDDECPFEEMCKI